MNRRGAAVYEIIRHLRPVVLNSGRVVDAEVRKLGWTVGSRAVVEVLADAEPATVPQLAAQLSLARQNVQRHVDELVRLGHARTSRNPAHRRSVLVHLTAEGRNAFHRAHARELDDLGALAAGCTDADLGAAEKVLAALDRDIAAVATRSSKGTS